VQLREVSGQVQAVDRRQRSMTVVAPASGGAPARTWQLSVGEATAFTNKDGGKLTFEDVGLADQVEVKGFEQAPAAGALQVAQLRVVVSAVAQAAAAKASRVLVLLDGATNLRTPQYGFTGDWIKRLHDTGYAVTPQEPASISANTNLRDFNLIVIGYPATLSDAAIQAVTSSKVPVLNAEPRLVQRLGLGLNVDPQQPIHMVAGKQVEVAGGANPVTKGFAGETAVANDTLYRTPIVASGTVLGTILDGGRRQAVWSVTGSTMYFGFWWSNTGQNHNATYWTLFDRSVLLLLGKDPLAPPTAR
jgi:hypothetical protein